MIKDTIIYNNETLHIFRNSKISQHIEHFITVIMRAQKAGGGWGDQRNIYLLIFCEITQFPLLLVAINMSS